MMRINDGEKEVEVKKQAGSLDASADGFVPYLGGLPGCLRQKSNGRCERALVNMKSERIIISGDHHVLVKYL